MKRLFKIGLIQALTIILVISCKENNEISEEQTHTFVKFFGGQGIDYASDMIAFDDGYALTGTIFTPDSGYQAFFIALDRYGNKLPGAPKTFGDTLYDVGNKIFRLQSGDFIIVGTHYTTEAIANMLVAKISSSGNLLWKKYFGGSEMKEGLFGIESDLNTIMVGGYSKYDGQKDICIYKLDSNGDSLWMSNLGASNDETGKDIVKLNSDYFVVGTTNSYSISNKNEIIVIKIDNNSGKALNFTILGSDTLDLTALKLDYKDNDLILLGKPYDNTLNKNGIYTARIHKDLNSTIWDKVYFSDNSLEPADLMISDNHFYIVANNISINAPVTRLKYDYNGIVTDSAYINTTSDISAYSAIIASDGKICIAGSSGIQFNSQIAIIKGL